MAAGIYVVIEFFISKINNANAYDWIGMLAGLFAVIFMGYSFIRMTRNRIILNESEIFVPENWGNKNNKIQFETHIAYTEIIKIYIISSDKNSLNKTSRWVFTQMPYIVFECKDNKQKAVNVFYYSKKQVVRIIDETIERAKSLGSPMDANTGAEILSDFLKLQKNKNK